MSTLIRVPPKSKVEDVVAAARSLIEAVVRAGDQLDPVAGDLTARLDAITDEATSAAASLDDRMKRIWKPDSPREHDPAAGAQNPLAPPMALRVENNRTVSGSVRLGLAYQGPPGIAHGGVAALLLDHALGYAVAQTGYTAVTASLSLQYRRPVPLFTKVKLAARCTSIEGRKLWAEGQLYDAEGPFVTVEGLFIATRGRDEDGELGRGG